LDDDQAGVDYINLVQKLRTSERLDAIGGIVYLSEMTDAIASVLNLSSYIDQVRDAATLRTLVKTCAGAIRESYEHQGTVTTLVAKFTAEILSLTQEHIRTETVHVREPMLELADLLEARRTAKQVITGIPTPWWYLNNMTCGLQPREMCLIAARPSCGKTAILVDLALHAASLPGKEARNVLFFSIEMKNIDISLRMLANRARVDGLKLRNGFWREEKTDRINDWAHAIALMPIHQNDDASITAQEIYMNVRQRKAQHGVDMVLIDYAQIITPTTRYNSRVDEMTEVSKVLKRIAKELDVAVVVAAQLGRDAEKERGGKKPYLSDIRDCGAFEQDADLVGLLWEPKINSDDEADMRWLKHHEPDDPKDDSKWVTQGKELGWSEEFRRINLSIGKNRNGPIGECELVFQKRSARFVDAHSPSRTKETML
jgi:replicative DNA helicase